MQEYQAMQYMHGIHAMNQSQYVSQEQFRGYYQPADMRSCGKNPKGKHPGNQHKNNTGAAAADKAGSKRSHERGHRPMSVKKSQQEHLSEKPKQPTTDRRARGKNPKQQPQKQPKQNAAAATANKVQKASLRVNSKQTKKRHKKQTQKANRKDKEKNNRKQNNKANKKANNKANQKQNSKTVNAFAALEQSDSEDES